MPGSVLPALALPSIRVVAAIGNVLAGKILFAGLVSCAVPRPVARNRREEHSRDPISHLLSFLPAWLTRFF